MGKISRNIKKDTSLKYRYCNYCNNIPDMGAPDQLCLYCQEGRENFQVMFFAFFIILGILYWYYKY